MLTHLFAPAYTRVVPCVPNDDLPVDLYEVLHVPIRVRRLLRFKQFYVCHLVLEAAQLFSIEIVRVDFRRRVEMELALLRKTTEQRGDSEQPTICAAGERGKDVQS